MLHVKVYKIGGVLENDFWEGTDTYKHARYKKILYKYWRQRM